MATAAPQTNGRSAPQKFQPGFDPEAIALKAIPGKPVKGYNGDQVLFHLTNGRPWYTDPAVAKEIERRMIQPGDIFQVCKTERRQGNSRITEIEISEVVIPEPASPAPSPNQSSGAGFKEIANHQPNVTTARMPAAIAANAVPAAVAVTAGAPLNGKGETSADQLARCYRSAIDIVANAVLYAAAQHLAIAPDFEDIRCCAATLHIAETNGRGRP